MGLVKLNANKVILHITISCNILVMLYVPFIIIHLAKYFLLLCFNYLNVYIHIREHLVLLSDIFIVLILLDILINNTFIYCYAFINSFTNIH